MNPVSVNNGFLEVCQPWTYAGSKGDMPFSRPFPCSLGTSQLAGTGFDHFGATGWLQTRRMSCPAKS